MAETLTDNQKKRIRQLKNYVEEVQYVEREDFDKWFKGKKTVCINVLSYLILIEDDE